MHQIESSPMTAAEIQQVRLHAEHLRGQEMARFLRRLFALLIAAPRGLFSAPSCARPLRPH